MRPLLSPSLFRMIRSKGLPFAIALIALPACTTVHSVQREGEVPALLRDLSERFTTDLTLCTGEVVRAWRVSHAADTLYALDAGTGRITPVPAGEVSEVRTVRVSPGNRVGPVVQELRDIGLHPVLYGMHVGRPHIARHLYRVEDSCLPPSQQK